MKETRTEVAAQLHILSSKSTLSPADQELCRKAANMLHTADTTIDELRDNIDDLIMTVR